ncbi:hypothetical protein HDF26_002216 [Pedobacter cryoconitis]|uniref:Glycosyl transferase family 25 n=1 Tax=Pedobacter cryoconitis TaxID=188932 RepID=A0A7W8ZJJ0_9SPHI|nr:glycosyltransferase family 9 protein [Pedobacter cryoconitis]MBB5635057.1 hypothetical protein [Pedobacter cryoconitis]MBB6271759.1 hypothetical protein [Pedobacter cryoconitis]
MKSITKILVLCDAHDCLRHEGLNLLLLKQLYTTVFLLKKHFAKSSYTLHVNSRGIIGFENFWPDTHHLSYFLNDYTIQEDWNTIDMSAYDLIITHPDYQKDLQQHFLQRYDLAVNEQRIYSFSELQYDCTMLYKIAATLFGKEGLLPFERSVENQNQLNVFKKEFDDGIHQVTIDQQEARIPQMDQLIEKINCRFQPERAKRILILDDFKRPFFIGDSVYWLAKIKKLMTILPADSEYCLNISNRAAFDPIYKIFQKSLPHNIYITNKDWKDLSFKEYDLILCNNDILLKFYHFIVVASAGHPNAIANENLSGQLVFYSFSAMDERPVSTKATMDFYTNACYHPGYSDQVKTKLGEEIMNTLSLLPEEHLWAKDWLVSNGIKESDRLIVLLHDASSKDKVIYDLTLFQFIRKLSGLSKNIRILLVTSKKVSDNIWLNELIRRRECANVILADTLSLREVMCLYTDQRVDAVIGPCTGLMHLAEGVYTHLLNQQLIVKPPLLLTYAGKQVPERRYHPNQWWKGSYLVRCLVHMRHAQGGNDNQLLLMAECPPDFEEFNRESIPAREINSELLFNFITEKFPEFIDQYAVTNHSHSAATDLPLLITKDSSPVCEKIPTFIISLEHRTDRRNHILKQFANQTAFDWTLVNAIENENGRLGLWLTIKKIVTESAYSGHEYILICEDDHQFTPAYSEQHLFASIAHAKNLNADILLGGICFCDDRIKQVNANLIAVDNFACTQFVIIFKSFFDHICTAEFLEHDCADLKMSDLSNKKLAIYPFISTQKDFGYSDVSSGYYESKMSIHFEETSRLIDNMIK